jgi:hypothetical protein
LTDHQGRRVQFGWQHISLPGTTGAQSLPRVITAAPEAAGGGLRFSPLPELETLHNASTHLTRSLALNAGQSVRQAGLDQHTGLHHHLKLNLTLDAEVASTFSVCVQSAGACAHPDVAVSFALHLPGTVRDKAALVLSVGGTSQTLELTPSQTGAVEISAEIFTDGQVRQMARPPQLTKTPRPN